MRFVRIVNRFYSADAHRAYLKSGGVAQNVPRDDMFKILQVDVDTTPKKLRAAYTQRIKENHPDVAFRHPGQPLIEMDLLKHCYEEILKGIDQENQENKIKNETTKTDRRNRRVQGMQWTIEDYRALRNTRRTVYSAWNTYIRWAITTIIFVWNFPKLWNYLTGKPDSSILCLISYI